MLEELSIEKVSLLSNNPDKVSQLEKYGINVTERVPLVEGVVSQNREYLITKVERMGHEMKLEGGSNGQD